MSVPLLIGGVQCVAGVFERDDKLGTRHGCSRGIDVGDDSDVLGVHAGAELQTTPLSTIRRDRS